MIVYGWRRLILLLLPLARATLKDQVPLWDETDEVRGFCPSGHGNYDLCLEKCERDQQWSPLSVLIEECAPAMAWDYPILLYRRRRWPVRSWEVYPRMSTTMINTFVVDLRTSGFEFPDDLGEIEQIIINPWEKLPLEEYCFERNIVTPLDEFELSVFNVTMEDFTCYVHTTMERKCSYQGDPITSVDLQRFNHYPKGPEWDGEQETDMRVRFNVTEFAVRYNTRSMKDGLLFYRHNYENECNTNNPGDGFIELVDRKWVRGDNFCENIDNCLQCQSAINCDWCLTASYEYKCTDYCLDKWRMSTCLYAKDTAYLAESHPTVYRQIAANQGH